MEPTTKTYYVVEIGGADFWFEQIQQASDFFAKLAATNAEKVERLGYGAEAYWYKDGKHLPKMHQETVLIYPTKKAAEFAKHEVGDKE